ncbi:unnamed protein product [Durusdinium trenchii]|uniref:Ephrin_rec_like domain-containing protein n=2 Tax=Durusdinium trenchii TaxID=1381693 RepID=A0ABP0NF79_9DINO
MGVLALYRILCLAALSSGQDQQKCLPGGVPVANRKYIQNDEGSDISIGLLEGAWPSAELLSELLRILIGEALGYHVHIHEKLGANGASPIFALAGCINFDAPANAPLFEEKRCGINETKIHVSIDSWLGSFPAAYEAMKSSFPEIAPVDLGPIGYEGEESIYVSQTVLNAAYEHSGIALEYYKSYNVSHNNVKQYFDSLGDVSKNELKLCNTTDFNNPQRIGNYLLYTGDYDGVEVQPDGSYFAKCFDGYWWAAPACRQNTTECLPVISAGNGWRLQAIMHWVSVYGFPAAVGISDQWSDFVKHVENTRALHYWWVPDSTFIEMQPHQLTFPRHSRSEWLRGDKKSGAAGTYIANMVSSNLVSKASKVSEFVGNINFELQEVQDLLLEFRRTGNKFEVACRWINQLQERWKSWVPVETNCMPGFGMVAVNGSFVQRRDDAVSCYVCPAGTSSQEFRDDDGQSYRCAACEPGRSQANTYKTQCEPCPRGTMSDVWGSTGCQPCQQGFYQDSLASTSCTPCDAGRTTKILGAVGQEYCVCQVGSIEVNGQCMPCGTGIACPLGSTLKELATNKESNPELPHVEFGFKSEAASPLGTFRCRGSACPGGAPGSCSGGREGFTCGECPAQTYLLEEQCTSCNNSLAPIFAVGVMLFVVGCVVAYYASNSKYEPRATVIFCCIGAMSIAVALMQNIGVLGTIPLRWPESTTGILNVGAIFLLDLDGIGLNCLAAGSSGGYVMTVVLFAVAICVVPLLGVVSNCIPWLKRRKLNWKKPKVLSMTGNFMLMSFTTLASVGLIPFMCYEHPTGDFSVLKHPNILCGSGEHQSMQVVGALVMTVATLFCAYCFWGALVAPTYSGRDRLMTFYFLINRFRPDVWWFGLMLLIRSAFVSLPAVIAANEPGLLVMLMLCVQQIYFSLLLWFLPWKAPVLNLADGFISGLLVVLLASCLEDVERDPSLSSTIRTVVAFGIIGCLLLLFFVLGVLLLIDKGCGRRQHDSVVLHLQSVPKPRELFTDFQKIARWMLQDADECAFESVVSELSRYDVSQIQSSLHLLSREFEVEIGRASRIRITNASISKDHRRTNASAQEAQEASTKDSVMEPKETNQDSMNDQPTSPALPDGETASVHSDPPEGTGLVSLEC